MRDNKGFVLIEFLMQGLSVTGLILVASMITLQLAMAFSKVTASRQQAYIAAMHLDLEDLRARQAIYFADARSYTSSTKELRFASSDGVAVKIVASPSGWSATATHPALGTREGCAIFFGTAPVPTSPVRPGRPGELVCTS